MTGSLPQHVVRLPLKMGHLNGRLFDLFFFLFSAKNKTHLDLGLQGCKTTARCRYAHVFFLPSSAIAANGKGAGSLTRGTLGEEGFGM